MWEIWRNMRKTEKYVGNMKEYVKNMKESLPSYMVSGTSPPCKLTAVVLGGMSVWGGPWRASTLGWRRGKENLKGRPCEFHIYNKGRTQNIQRHETRSLFFGLTKKLDWPIN